jgi:acyl-CoA synthetase (AMP-forming)/AMP-acid ligase II/acyl carrier protein
MTPDATALAWSEGGRLTYLELRDLAARTLAALTAAGAGRKDRVAMVLPNGPLMAGAFVAVASGATSAPLNPAYGADEFDFHLTDLNAKALLILAGMPSAARDVATARGIPLIELQPDKPGGAALFTLETSLRADARLVGSVDEDDVALVLHTSGTTSRPKIVPLTQANIWISAQNIANFLELSATDRCLNVMPLFHIHGLVGALMSSLVAGASVYCTEGFSAPRFSSQLRESGATWYTAVPTMHQAILAQEPAFVGHSLRFIRSCSSALPPQVMTDLEERFGVPVVEAYGMTEASHQMACNPLPPRTRKPGSVGIASGLEVAILDQTGSPDGRTGEICIRGASVTHGYENNPDANAQSFTAEHWFRTGDQGYLDDDGYLFITGRIKEIINRGGEKISPREIDEVLLDHPAVAQAVAFAAPHPTLGEDIAAAVVLRSGHTTSENELRTYASTRLAHFKVPRHVLFVPEIPKGPTGKLQRVGLAKRLGINGVASASPVKAAFVPARNVLDEALVAFYREIVNVTEIGIDDNFFLLGGDSLGATRLLVRVREALGAEVPITRFFSSPTIAALADYIAGRFPQVREVLKDIESMSEDEARSLLERESRR